MKLRIVPIGGLLLVQLSSSSCASPGANAAESAQQSDYQAPFEVVQQVWMAASQRGATSIGNLTDGSDPQDWISSRANAYPQFFQITAGRLRLEGGYVLDETETVVVQFHAPFVSCRPPANEGDDDTYFAKVRSTEQGWRVAEIWMDIC